VLRVRAACSAIRQPAAAVADLGLGHVPLGDSQYQPPGSGRPAAGLFPR